MKIRTIIASEVPSKRNAINFTKPTVNNRLPIPTGLAFSIQQLRIVNAAEQIYITCFPNEGHIFGMPTAVAPVWRPNDYATAPEYAREFGLTFSTVDLQKKDGSAWWLFRQVFKDNVFELHCPLPESNFTEAKVIVHAIFLNGEASDPSRVFVNLEPVGNGDYGIMLRAPHYGIHLNAYEAISFQAREVVTHVLLYGSNG